MRHFWIVLVLLSLLSAGAVRSSPTTEIKEPLFELLLRLAEHDSLGCWSPEEIEAGLSRLPMRQIVRVSRLRPDAAAQLHGFAGGRVQAIWQLELTSAHDGPMPYSILGYHPGSLRISRLIELTELAPTDLDLRYNESGTVVHRTVTDVRIFALTKGSIVLDADGWLDALLGSGLDDSWTLGFVTGRENGRLIGLGISTTRDGGSVYGEFDFAADKILSAGRPLIGALSRASRQWLNTSDANLPMPWASRNTR